MPIRLAPAVVDALLLGPESRRRQLQDFPVLGDVWTKFADEPGEVHDLLIIPTRERPTGEVVSMISSDHGGRPEQGCSVAYLQDLVVASFGLNHLYRVLIPATSWWDQIEDRCAVSGKIKLKPRWLRLELIDTLGEKAWKAIEPPKTPDAPEPSPAARKKMDAERAEFDGLKTGLRQAVKLGLLLGVFTAAAAAPGEPAAADAPKPVPDLAEAVAMLGWRRIVKQGVAAIDAVSARHRLFQSDDEPDWNGVIFQVTLNRDAEAALTESVPAIKADAARQLFSISCVLISSGSSLLCGAISLARSST